MTKQATSRREKIRAEVVRQRAAHLKAQSAWSFIDVLNNPDTRRQVDFIEDVMNSLRGRETEPTLRDMLIRAVRELEKATGFTYQPALDMVNA
jgi:hypothetical protein